MSYTQLCKQQQWENTRDAAMGKCEGCRSQKTRGMLRWETMRDAAECRKYRREQKI